MGKASRDENQVTSILAKWRNDGITPLPILANPSTHAMMIDLGTTGSDLGDDNAAKDPNFVSSMLAVSKTDGSTVVPLFATSGGNLLIDNT